MDDSSSWLRLMAMSWLGPTLQAGLIKTFTTPDKAASANIDEILDIKGFDYKRALRFLNEYSKTAPLCDPATLEDKEIEFINYNDEHYPDLLRETADPPIGLFVKGKMPSIAPTIAIVGSRHATQLGYDVARNFGYALTKAGFIVVSGLALGIDTYAHLGAIDAKGITIAVVGGGVDIIYPPRNRRVHNEILSTGGAIISEYPPGAPTLPWHFPIRNRIISGMSLGVLVIEANKQSGSMLTACHAGDQDRDIFAIPGNINQAGAQGTIELLKNGATLVSSPDDIINYYAEILPHMDIKVNEETVEPMEEEEKKLYEQIAQKPMTVDDLLDLKWKPEILFSLLLSLEMRDYIIKLPNNCYQTRLREVKR